MNALKFIILTLLIFLFSACIGEKKLKKEDVQKEEKEKPKKETPQKVNLTVPTDLYSHLGDLSREQSIVQNELISYLQELKTFNTTAIVEKTYPKLFDVINIRNFKQYISTMMNSTDILVESFDTNISNISQVTALENSIQYAKVSYTSKAKIVFLNPNLYNTKSSMNYLYDVLIHKYGQENIEINVANRTLSIKKEEKMLVIKEAENDWKFLGNNKEFQQLYPEILPMEILNHLALTQ